MGNDLVFRTRGSQLVGSFRLHYLSVSRQVSYLHVLIDYFTTKYVQNNIIAFQKEKLFSNDVKCYKYCLAGDGTMDGTDIMVEVPSYGKYIPRN